MFHCSFQHVKREPCAIEPQLLQPEQLRVEHGEPLQDLVLGHGTQVERDTMRDRRFELRTVDAPERNVRVLSASRLFFGPDDADDAVAVFAFDPAIPAAEVAIDVAEGSHLFGHYVGPGSA